MRPGREVGVSRLPARVLGTRRDLRRPSAVPPGCAARSYRAHTSVCARMGLDDSSWAHTLNTHETAAHALASVVRKGHRIVTFRPARDPGAMTRSRPDW